MRIDIQFFTKQPVSFFQLIDIVVFFSFFPSGFHLGQGQAVIGEDKFVDIIQIGLRMRSKCLDKSRMIVIGFSEF